MKITDILKYTWDDLNKMSKKELSRITTILNSAANKRIKRGLLTDSMKETYAGHHFSTPRSANVNDIRKSFKDVKTFLENPYSSKKGTLAEWKRISEDLKKGGVDIPPERINDVLKAYRKAKEVEPSVAWKEYKYRVLANAAMQDQEANVDARALELKIIVRDYYEQTERAFSQISNPLKK